MFCGGGGGGGGGGEGGGGLNYQYIEGCRSANSTSGGGGGGGVLSAFGPSPFWLRP